MPSPTEFMQAAPKPLNGNTPWASRYAAEIRRWWVDEANEAPRSLQRHLGPSELGAACDRQVAGKMAGVPRTNHVIDPWASIRGRALHKHAEAVFERANNRLGRPRFLVEFRVVPHPDHAGTGDLYDADESAVVDHKFLGRTSMDKLVRDGAPRRYVVQLLLYAHGFRLLGLNVARVVLLAYPATGPSLDGLYVWERPYTPADDELLAEVWSDTARRQQWAAALITGQCELSDIPASPESGECHFCPFYRPQAKDGGAGCPGHALR